MGVQLSAGRTSHKRRGSPDKSIPIFVVQVHWDTQVVLDDITHNVCQASPQLTRCREQHESENEGPNQDPPIRKQGGPNQETPRTESEKRTGPNQETPRAESERRSQRRVRPNQKTPRAEIRPAARAESETTKGRMRPTPIRTQPRAESENVSAERDRLVGDCDAPNWNRSIHTYIYMFIYTHIHLHFHVRVHVHPIYMTCTYSVHARYIYASPVCM